MEPQKETSGLNRLRELREEAVLTVRELSKLSGVSEDTITKIENGHRKARPSTIRKLAKVLNIDPRVLTSTDVIAPKVGAMTSRSYPVELKEGRRSVELSGTASGRSSAQAQPTVTVSVSLDLRWNIAEALRNGEELNGDQLRELEEAARAQLTAE